MWRGVLQVLTFFGFLGDLKSLDEIEIVDELALGFLEHAQNLFVEIFKLRIVVGLLADKIVLLFFEVRFHLLNDDGDQLVLQTFFLHSEVHQSDSRTHFGFISRVREFRRHVEAEIGVVPSVGLFFSRGAS